jgi:thiol-disulfide isomerase/thioredoxin
MKKTFLCIAFLLAIVAAEAQQNLVIEPAKAQPGSTVTIRYNPKNTELSGVKDFQATAYLLEGTLPVALEIPLKEDKGVYVGSFKTNDTTRAFFVSFSKNEITDNNADKGYYAALYDKSGNPVMGANSALAMGFSSYYSLWSMKRNADVAKELNKTEFTSAASRAKFYNDYFSYLGSGEEADKELLKKELQNHLAKGGLSEVDMMRVKSYYETTLKDKEKGEAVFASVKEKFPAGNWKRAELTTAFNKETDLEKKTALFNQILAAYPATKDNQPTINMIARTMAQRHADDAAYDKMDQYLSYIKDKSQQASFYNGLALKLAGGGITKTPVNVSKGLEFSQKALDLMQEEMKNPSNKTPFYTAKQFLKNQNYTYHSYLNTNAILLYHNNQADKAYVIQKQAVDLFERKNININEAFALVTEKAKGAGEAQKELEGFIAEGKSTPAMREQLKNLYLKNNSEAQWAKYVDQLDMTAFNNLKAELAKKMINMPAPQFALKDLSGKNVSLASLKGKVVVVDFWATWCGPCIASFPGMQKAIDKFKNNPDVVFLFIDTWEAGEDREKKVTGFLEKNKYPFNVLYDDEKVPNSNTNEFVVVSDYKVDGIPTKFVIDKNNNIRFKSVGYNGSTDGLLSEITAMIEMANTYSNQTGPAQKKKVME